MKAFFKGMLLGIMISAFCCLSFLLLGFSIFILTQIHTVEGAWQAVAAFVGALIVFSCWVVVNYSISILPWNIKDNWRP